mmetsp:Transcript_5007/g.10101  ORF Transcript_5007/g.10101 Transcript_5007/m.10101 type:complete len:103 (+) Transcript_5007:308-616(+)
MIAYHSLAVDGGSAAVLNANRSSEWSRKDRYLVCVPEKEPQLVEVEDDVNRNENERRCPPINAMAIEPGVRSPPHLASFAPRCQPAAGAVKRRGGRPDVLRV